MTDLEGQRKPDPEEIKAAARAARELCDSEIFKRAILDLRKQWFGALMTTVSRDDQSALIFRLQALEAIPAQLQIYINNGLMLEKRNGR